MDGQNPSTRRLWVAAAAFATAGLEVEGFYEIVPPGQPGNEFRVRLVETGKTK